MMYQAKNKMHGTHIVKFPIFFILVVLKINESSGVHKANRDLHAPHLHITYSNSESSESGLFDDLLFTWVNGIIFPIFNDSEDT